jgi:hypothetical protein
LAKSAVGDDPPEEIAVLTELYIGCELVDLQRLVECKPQRLESDAMMAFLRLVKLSERLPIKRDLAAGTFSFPKEEMIPFVKELGSPAGIASLKCIIDLLEGAGDSETRALGLPDLVTLDQAAAAVHKWKRTLENFKTKRELPAPTIKGGRGKPHLWDWQAIRPWLKDKFGIELPERYPGNRGR